MKGLKQRLITGSIIFAVFVGVLLLTLLIKDTNYNWVFFDVFVTILALFASVEMCNAIGKKYPKPLLSIALCTVVLGFAAFIVAQTAVKIGGITSFFCVMLIMCLVAIVYSLCSKKIGTTNVVATMFVLVYPISALMYLLAINHLPSPYRADTLLLLFAVAPLTDTFAFFVGSMLKGKKLCPKISPNKTISGAIGGLIGGTVGGVVLYFVSLTAVGEFFGMGPLANGVGNCINFICMGILCSFFTQVGDLFASYIKRMVGIKDYSNLLPGHGGIMDRIDGLILAGIVVFLYTSILIAI
ncbi:MAG: phosphatidate cytidylyltransferase [Clostridiales bacterium]|nr:phosphatidate cytidylyltransferase [Clostridiales bacterium]